MKEKLSDLLDKLETFITLPFAKVEEWGNKIEKYLEKK